jgi:hypothetical protein
MFEAAISDHFTDMLEVHVRDFTLLRNPWPENVDLDDIYRILISVLKSRNSVLTNPQDESACSTTRIIPEFISQNIPGTNQVLPSVMQREVVSDAPLFKLAPYTDPILSSASLSRHRQSDLTWPIPRHRLPTAPTS